MLKRVDLLHQIFDRRLLRRDRFGCEHADKHGNNDVQAPHNPVNRCLFTLNPATPSPLLPPAASPSKNERSHGYTERPIRCENFDDDRRVTVP